MKQRNSETLVDEIFRLILSEILDGKIAQGQAVNELAIATRLNVSRGPVREAVKRIEGVGLIEKTPYLKARVIELSLANMIEVFQIREGIESVSARLAAEFMSDRDIDRLLADFTRSVSEGKALDIHVRIAEGCGNERIRRYLCDELYYLLRMYRYRSVRTPGRRETAQFEHSQILNALKARDAKQAEQLMRNHIQRATQSLQAQLAENRAEQVSNGNR